MECLENLVGINDCETLSEAPYTIEQAGLSRKQLEKLLDDSYATVDLWFDAMRAKAAADIVSDIIGNITTGIKSNTLLENGVIGEYQDGRTSISTTTYGGIAIDIDNTKDYINLNIKSISLYMNYTGDVSVDVINSRTGKVLETVTVAAVTNEIVIVPTSITIPNNKQPLSISVVYDTTSKPSLKTTMSGRDSFCCGRCDSRSASNAYFKSINAVSPFLVGNNSARNDTAGMALEYTFECDQENWVCSISNQLGLAMLYRTAYNLLDYSVMSGGRINDQKTINIENNIERKDSFEFKYGNQLKNVLASVKFPVGKCFECFKRISIRNVLP